MKLTNRQFNRLKSIISKIDKEQYYYNSITKDVNNLNKLIKQIEEDNEDRIND